MSNQQQDMRPQQEAFPYKTYDEILMEKERRLRFRRGMVVMSGIFLMLCAILIGISMVWNRSTNPLSLFQPRPEDQSLGSDPALSHEKDFVLAASSGPEEKEQTPDTPVYGVDVSGLVKKARPFVVGVQAEWYKGKRIQTQACSGVILSEDGYILTDNRVVDGSDGIHVIMYNGESYAAFLIGSDDGTGIAVLKVDASGLTEAQMGDSSQLEMGQTAVAMGSVSGTDTGIISGLDFELETDNGRLQLIQISASVNAGNSGGPLLNQYGQMIGMNASGFSADGFEGMGFAVPVNTLRHIIEALVQGN